jgi:hypothetical protein
MARRTPRYVVSRMTLDWHSSTLMLDNRGRWDSNTFKAVWVVLSLVPVMVAVIGVVTWRQRIVLERRFDWGAFERFHTPLRSSPSRWPCEWCTSGRCAARHSSPS